MPLVSQGLELGAGRGAGWRGKSDLAGSGILRRAKVLGGPVPGNWLFLIRGTFVGSSETPSCPGTRYLPPAVPIWAERAGAYSPPPAPVFRDPPNTGSSDRISCTFPDCPHPQLPISWVRILIQNHLKKPHWQVPAGAWECWEFRLSPKLRTLSPSPPITKM